MVLDDDKRVTVVVTTATGKLVALSTTPGEPVERQELGTVEHIPWLWVSGTPEAAVTGTGLVVVWDCPESGLCARRRTANGWRPAAELDATVGDDFALAVGPTSTAMVVTSWGDVWRSPKTASPWRRDAGFGSDFYNPDIAVGARGKAAVCNRNAVAFRFPDGTWSRMRPVSDRPATDNPCSITVDGEGTYTATWLEEVRGQEMSAAAQGRPRHGWSARTLLGDVEQDYSFRVHSAASASGHVLVVYHDDVGEHAVFKR